VTEYCLKFHTSDSVAGGQTRTLSHAVNHTLHYTVISWCLGIILNDNHPPVYVSCQRTFSALNELQRYIHCQLGQSSISVLN
jgi:hypothetical protein